MSKSHTLKTLLGSAMCLWALGCEIGEDFDGNDEDFESYAAVVGTYQAEDFTFQNGCAKTTAHAGYTGTGFVDYGGNGTLIEWNNVNVPSAGQYTLVFRYATSAGNRPCAITVNDTTNAGNVGFDRTGAWTTWGTQAIKVSLKQGNNKIRVTANTSAGGPNLDKMDVTSENTETGTGGQCALVSEGGTANLSCPSGQAIGSIAFASYGTPTGSCPSFVSSGCHASTSKSKVEALCLNKQTCSVGANNGVFGDPCVGTFKKLAVVYSCAGTVSWSCPPGLPVPAIGGCNGVLLTDSSSIEAQSSGIVKTTGPLGAPAVRVDNGQSMDLKDEGCLQLGKDGMSFSLAMWVKVAGPTDRNTQIIGTNDQYGRGQGFILYTYKNWWNDQLSFGVGSGKTGGGYMDMSSPQSFNPNTWVHVVLRYENRPGDASAFTLTVNGKSNTGSAFPNVHNDTLRIGDRGWGDHASFEVADLRSSQRVLSDAEVKSLFAERAAVNGLSRSELADALNKLQGHIKKTALLSDEQLKAQADRFVASAMYFETDAGLMRQALDTISAFETTYGALFMTEATKNGIKKAGTPGDGLALARAMVLVQQAALDNIFTLPSVGGCGEQLLRGKRYLTADYFPGAAPPPSDPSASRDVRILASVPANWGRPVAFATDPVRRPMGLYLSPGSLVRVTVPRSMVNAGFEVLVGAHTADHGEKGSLRRLERVSKSFPITRESTYVANPLGGGLYIVVPYLANLGVVTVQVQGAIEAPFFSLKSFDTTTAQQWQTRRTAPGPWADFETDKFMMQVPRSWIYASGDPTAVMRDWDKAMDGVSEIMGYPLEKRNRTVLYQQVDVDIRANGVYGIGYPQINNTYNPYQQENGNHQSWLLTNPTQYEVDYHELGHAQMPSMFRGEVEAINNFPHAYLRNVKFGVHFDVAFRQSFGPSYGDLGFTPDDAAINWMLTENFRAGKEMDHSNTNTDQFRYQQRGYAKYADIYRIFGWDALRKFSYQEHLDYMAHTPSDGLNEVDSRILRMSVAAGGDLTPLIHFWGIHPVDPVALKQKMTARGIGASQAVRAFIERYKTIAPKNNADFNAHFERVYPGRPTGKNSDYDALRNAFNETHAAQIQAEIQRVISLYYQ